MCKLQNRTSSIKNTKRKAQTDCYWIWEEIIYVNYKPPHLYPTGRSWMLQRLGMVTATSGFTPELRAVFESMTAQRHFGFWPIFLTWAQHWAETEAFSSCAADAQGASLKASMSGETPLPHSPAPRTWFSSPMPRIKNRARKQMHFVEASIFRVCSV